MILRNKRFVLISNQIGNSFYEIVESIVCFVNSFDVDKLLYAIDIKRFDEDTIENIKLDIQSQNAKLSKQKKYLFDYTKTFNKTYALEDNKFVEHSERLLHRLRSGVSGIKRQAKRFCKSSHRKLPEGAETPKAIKKSLLVTEEYMRDLFGLESYPACVKELFIEMVKFYNTLSECLTEARRSLEEEMITKKNNPKCLKLLIEAQEKCRKYQVIFIKAMESSPELKEMIIRTQGLMPVKEDSVINDWKNCEATEEGQGRFASHYFHNCTLDDVGRITLYRTIAEADGDADVFECMTLFRCDRGKALCINRAIGSFDTLLPQKCKRNKIPATQLFVFMKWCSGSIGYNTFLSYFNKHYKGLHGIISSPSALAGAAKKLQKTSDVYKDMMEKLQKISQKYRQRRLPEASKTLFVFYSPYIIIGNLLNTISRSGMIVNRNLSLVIHDFFP